MTDEEELSDAFIEKFKRKPEDPRPEWAFRGENILKEMDEVPLFMTDVPDNVNDIPALAALQSLLYEGSPEEVAKNFKDQGNEAFKIGPSGYIDAIKYYTQGLDQKCNDHVLNALLHLNRAAVHISRKNFGKTLEDCQAALNLDSESANIRIKGHLRAAKACLALEMFPEALDHVKAVPSTEDVKTNEEVSQLESSIKEAIEKEKKRIADLEKRSKLAKKIDVLLKSRGIERVPDSERHLLSLLGPAGTVDPSRLPSLSIVPKTASQLQFPVMLFYPPYGESDCIEAWHEHTTFLDVLKMVMSEQPAWDTDSIYKPGKPLNVYWSTHGDGTELYHIDPKYRLADLFGKLVKQVDRGLLAFFVLPSGTTAEANFLQRFSTTPISFKP